MTDGSIICCQPRGGYKRRAKGLAASLRQQISIDATFLPGLAAFSKSGLATRSWPGVPGIATEIVAAVTTARE
jgi:hypothetical protein